MIIVMRNVWSFQEMEVQLDPGCRIDSYKLDPFGVELRVSCFSFLLNSKGDKINDKFYPVGTKP